MNNVKFTHKVTLNRGHRAGDSFLCAIVGRRVFVSPFTTENGDTYGGYDEYDADHELDELTPELWYDDPMRWTVKKLNQFKGNK